MKLYDNYEDVLNRCPDSIYEAVKETVNSIEEKRNKGGELDFSTEYTSIMLYMQGESIYNKAALCDRTVDLGSLADPFIIKQLPAGYDRENEALSLSSLLHLMHNEDPDAHQKATSSVSILKDRLAKAQGADSKFFEKVTLPCPDFLTGKDKFPEYLLEMVKESLNQYMPDLSVSGGITWENSHFDNGSDYDYDISEEAYVTIRSPYMESLAAARETLGGLTKDDISQYRNSYWVDSCLSESNGERMEMISENRHCCSYYVEQGEDGKSPLVSFSPENLVSSDGERIMPMITVETEEEYAMYVRDDYMRQSDDTGRGISREIYTFCNDWYEDYDYTYYDAETDEDKEKINPPYESKLPYNCNGIPYTQIRFEKHDEWNEGWFYEMTNCVLEHFGRYEAALEPYFAEMETETEMETEDEEFDIG